MLIAADGVWVKGGELLWVLSSGDSHKRPVKSAILTGCAGVWHMLLGHEVSVHLRSPPSTGALEVVCWEGGLSGTCESG